MESTEAESAVAATNVNSQQQLAQGGLLLCAQELTQPHSILAELQEIVSAEGIKAQGGGFTCLRSHSTATARIRIQVCLSLKL